jgi:threonine/homoserine/homoserine lactone efflux protein
MEHLPVILGATLVWFAVIVSPGPNFLVISRLALSGSLASAIAATFGIAIGSLVYAALTMFGLSAFLRPTTHASKFTSHPTRSGVRASMMCF